MNEIMQDAIIKISNEINDNKDNKNIKHIGDYVIGLIKQSEDNAKKVLIKGKTLKGCFEMIKNEAMKIATNNFTMMSYIEVYKVVREYFDIKDNSCRGLILDFDDVFKDQVFHEKD